MDTEEPERILELGLIKQVDRIRALLSFFLLVLVFAAPAGLLTNPGAAYSAVSVAALMTIWTLFFLNLEVLWTRAYLPLVAGVVLVADVAWLSLFIYGTGGFHSPFASLLLLPILFGAVFLGGLATALPAVTAIVAIIHVCFAMTAIPTPAVTWEVAGRLVTVIAVAWLAYGLTRILELERRANESVVRNLTEGVLLIDGKRTIVLANPQIEKVCKLPMDMIVGRRIASIPQEPGYHCLLETVADVGRDRRDLRPIRRDITLEVPEPVDLRITTIPYAGRWRRPLGWVVVCQDISDIKAVARMKEEGLAILSHEIRSPLATLRAVSQVLSTLTGELSPQERAQALSAIEDESQRLLELVADLLDVSALEQGSYEPELESVEVEDLIREVVRAFEFKVRPRNISMATDVPPDLPTINADRGQVQQALTNLCENAVKHTSQGGTVKVAAARQDGHMDITVSDTGCGIPPEKMEAIFAKFGQLEMAPDIAEGARGVGLGLYIARTIARLHGGDIRVDSTVGEGSAFHLVLPVSERMRVTTSLGSRNSASW